MNSRFPELLLSSTAPTREWWCCWHDNDMNSLPLDIWNANRALATVSCSSCSQLQSRRYFMGFHGIWMNPHDHHDPHDDSGRHRRFACLKIRGNQAPNGPIGILVNSRWKSSWVRRLPRLPDECPEAVGVIFMLSSCHQWCHYHVVNIVSSSQFAWCWVTICVYIHCDPSISPNASTYLLVINMIIWLYSKLYSHFSCWKIRKFHEWPVGGNETKTLKIEGSPRPTSAQKWYGTSKKKILQDFRIKIICKHYICFVDVRGFSLDLSWDNESWGRACRSPWRDWAREAFVDFIVTCFLFTAATFLGGFRWVILLSSKSLWPLWLEKICNALSGTKIVRVCKRSFLFSDCCSFRFVFTVQIFSTI